MTSIYRTGRTIYRDDELIGAMCTTEHAELVVEALKARERVLAAPGRTDRDPSVPQSCQDGNGEACPPERCQVNGAHYATRLPDGGTCATLPPSESLLLPLPPSAGCVDCPGPGVVHQHMAVRR